LPSFDQDHDANTPDPDHRAALAEIEKLWVASIGTPDAARRAAEDAFLDRTDLTVSPKAYAESLGTLGRAAHHSRPDRLEIDLAQ
jgi:hypothetical protein